MRIILTVIIIILGGVVSAQNYFPPAPGNWYPYGGPKVVLGTDVYSMTIFNNKIFILAALDSVEGVKVGHLFTFDGHNVASLHANVPNSYYAGCVYKNYFYAISDNEGKSSSNIKINQAIVRWDSIYGWQEVPGFAENNIQINGSSFHGIVYHDTLFIITDLDNYGNSVSYGGVVCYDGGNNWFSGGETTYSLLSTPFIFKGDLYVTRTLYPPWLFRYRGIGHWEIVFDCNQNNCDIGQYLGEAVAVDTLNNFVYFILLTDYIENHPLEHYTTLARWDGYSIEPLDTFMAWNRSISACFYKHKLFIGGITRLYPDYFNDPNTYYNAMGMIIWDPKDKQYKDLAGGIPGSVRDMVVYHDTLFVGGNFSSTGDTFHNNVDTNNRLLARWYMEDDPGCWYIEPRIYFNHSALDTFYIPYDADSISIYLENNNPYVDSWLWDLGDGGSDTVQCLYHTYHDTGVYNVKITVTFDDSCQASYTRNLVILKDTTGNSDTTSVIYARISKSFKIYPNPAKDRFTVEANTYNFDDVLLKVYSGVGYNKRVMALHSGYNRKEINMQDSRSGVYFVSLVRKGKIIATKKVILKR